MTEYNKEIDVLSAYVHGVLSGFHALGFIFNYKRKNKLDTVIHGLALLYDLKSTYTHIKQSKGLEGKL